MVTLYITTTIFYVLCICKYTVFNYSNIIHTNKAAWMDSEMDFTQQTTELLQLLVIILSSTAVQTVCLALYNVIMFVNVN